MATKNILIDQLLEYKLSPPVWWLLLIAIPPFGLSWYQFVQTVKHEADLNITKVTLHLIIKPTLKLFTGTTAYRSMEVKFNDASVLTYYFTKSDYTYEFDIDVTSLYRKLSGTTPQILEIGVQPATPFSTEYYTITAYLELEYTGTEPSAYTSTSTQTPLPQELINLIIGFAFMSIMMTMMVGMMTTLTSIPFGGE